MSVVVMWLWWGLLGFATVAVGVWVTTDTHRVVKFMFEDIVFM